MSEEGEQRGGGPEEEGEALPAASGATPTSTGRVLVSALIRPESAAVAEGPTFWDWVLPPEALATHCYLDAELKEGAVKRPLAKGFLKALEPRLQPAYARVATELKSAGMFCPVGTFKHNSCRKFLRFLLPPGARMPPAGTVCCVSFRRQAHGVMLGQPGAPTHARYNRKNLPGVMGYLRALLGGDSSGEEINSGNLVSRMTGDRPGPGAEGVPLLARARAQK
jgi:hypothetical protein